MTVTYTKNVSDTSFCGFSKLLFRWRGSVFKLVWPDLIVYLVMYCTCSVVYRFILSDENRRVFEKVALTCEYFRNVFPISFVLGFYVTIVVQRWWAQYMLIPWPDTVCILASAYIQGQDERGRLLRKSFARYINLAFALAFSRISPRVRRRYPTYDHFIRAGYMTANEKEIFEMTDEHSQQHKIWMPLTWASLLVTRARKEGRCPDDYGQKTIIKEITNLRYNCGKLQEYHTMSVPLVYTQVVTMATYSYFGFSILGRQFLDPQQGYDNHIIDFYVPIFTFLQFFFYMGWLKVAESLLNPFGDDDDDFETNDFLDRHFEVSYMIVDVMHKVYPDILHNSYEDTAKHDVHKNITPVVRNSKRPSQATKPKCLSPPYKNISGLSRRMFGVKNEVPSPPLEHNGNAIQCPPQRLQETLSCSGLRGGGGSSGNEQPYTKHHNFGTSDPQITIHTSI